MGLLAHRRLPGGHYRIPVEALAAFWEANEKLPAVGTDRPAGSERTRGAGRDPQRQHRSRPARRPVAVGEDRSTMSYDLSMEELAALRAQFS